MNKASLWISCLVLFLLAGCTNAGKQAAEEETTFTNPVIYADVPDVDVIRVGSDYYMISTTAHMSPGAPIMHSKDMVNWTMGCFLTLSRRTFLCILRYRKQILHLYGKRSGRKMGTEACD